MMKKIKIYRLSSTNLEFLEYFDGCKDFCVRNFDFRELHLSRWRVLNRLCLYYLVLAATIDFLFQSRSVVFGSRLCVIFAYVNSFFRAGKVVYILNEVDDKFLSIGDRVKAEFRRQFLVVSNIERAEILREALGEDVSISICHNVPVDLSKFEHEHPIERLAQLIYVGQVTLKRFPLGTFEKLRDFCLAQNLSVRFFGVDSLGLLQSHDIIDYGGIISHHDVYRQLTVSQYGLLSYGMLDNNNRFCAPIKIFEYLAIGVIPVSVFDNPSLKRLNETYPNLIIFLNDFESLRFDAEEHALSAKRYVSDCRLDNMALFSEVTSFLVNSP